MLDNLLGKYGGPEKGPKSGERKKDEIGGKKKRSRESFSFLRIIDFVLRIVDFSLQQGLDLGKGGVLGTMTTTLLNPQSDSQIATIGLPVEYVGDGVEARGFPGMIRSIIFKGFVC